MVEIYGININESLGMNNIQSLIKHISPARRERAMRLYRIQDSYRSVLGEILVRYAICYKSGCLNKEIEMRFTTGQKPKLLFPTDLFFNISHSGDWVVCALSSNTVGVDVEYMQKVNLQIAKSFFSSSEYRFILNQDSEEEFQKRFYRVWTLKESYVKADGRGLLLPMKSFSILFDEDCIFVDTENRLKNCNFKTFQIGDDYIAAVCSVEKPIRDRFEELNIRDVVRCLHST